MYLMVDNYDSFVHTLTSYFAELGCDMRIVRNDALNVGRVLDLARGGELQGVVISPGPKTPEQSGSCPQLVQALQQWGGASARPIPILGVCLGHQVIAQANGARVRRGYAGCADAIRGGCTRPRARLRNGILPAAPQGRTALRRRSRCRRRRIAGRCAACRGGVRAVRPSGCGIRC